MPDSDVDSWDWSHYLTKVRAECDESNRATLVRRLAVINHVQAIFRQYGTFQQMPKDMRYSVAGTVRGQENNEVNFGWFGGMYGARRFLSAVCQNNKHLSTALHIIPIEGEVRREQYNAYITELSRAFPQGGLGIATATRLLAMKRPDTFLCVSKYNLRKTCDALGLSQTIGYETYWDSIIALIKDSPWWNADRPAEGEGRLIWDARSAFLDAIFFDWDLR